MALEFTTSYLKDSLTIFRHYKRLAERAIEQISDADLFTELGPETNSIAVIVKHLAGNMRSRWTDFLTTDGEKPDRNRDSEFEAPSQTRTQVLELWEQGWKCLFSAIEPLADAELTRTIFIRGEAHSVMQAINRQVAHYQYHIGQIVLLARHFAGDRWQSLTIPRKLQPNSIAKSLPARPVSGDFCGLRAMHLSDTMRDGLRPIFLRTLSQAH